MGCCIVRSRNRIDDAETIEDFVSIAQSEENGFKILFMSNHLNAFTMFNVLREIAGDKGNSIYHALRHPLSDSVTLLLGYEHHLNEELHLYAKRMQASFREPIGLGGDYFKDLCFYNHYYSLEIYKTIRERSRASIRERTLTVKQAVEDDQEKEFKSLTLDFTLKRKEIRCHCGANNTFRGTGYCRKHIFSVMKVPKTSGRGTLARLPMDVVDIIESFFISTFEKRTLSMGFYRDFDSSRAAGFSILRAGSRLFHIKRINLLLLHDNNNTSVVEAFSA